MPRIWLNHWFSTAYCIIELMREGLPDAHFLGTNRRLESPIRLVCDQWEAEPEVEGAEYVRWCLEYCEKNHVDVFVPRRGAIDIAGARADFEARGTRVMLEDAPIMEVMGSKDRAYALFEERRIGIVPQYAVVTDVSGFEAAYANLSSRYERVCFKFVRDVGGKSYRLIDNGIDPYAALYRKQGTRISLEAALAALGSRESFPPLMLMPYLPGDEVSVDCLMTQDGLIALPRVKDPTRVERVRFDEEILFFCRDLYSKIPLEQPCNIQFKYLDGVPYILEVNTRMSGGIQMACRATGANIPAVAAGRLLGRRLPWHVDRKERAVSHIEMPVVL